MKQVNWSAIPDLKIPKTWWMQFVEDKIKKFFLIFYESNFHLSKIEIDYNLIQEYFAAKGRK